LLSVRERISFLAGVRTGIESDVPQWQQKFTCSEYSFPH